jgi:signal peptidase I
MRKSLNRKILIFCKGWGYSIFIAIVIATSFKSAIADWNVVPTGSMKPTIIEGDRIFVNKLAYDLKVPYTTLHITQWSDPQRGDIVVFYSPADNKRLVKRVVGIPGDKISMTDNNLMINGVRINYDNLHERIPDILDNEIRATHFLCEDLAGRKHPVMITPSCPSLRSFGPITVPESHYFMMGDNRDRSADSRIFGFVERDKIVGRATAVVLSFDIKNRYRPRWERSFLKLP